MLIWLALLNWFPVGEVLTSGFLFSYPLASEIRISDRRPLMIPPPVLAQDVTPEARKQESRWMWILAIFGVSAGVWWLSRSLLILRELEDVPTGQFAVEVKRMGDRRIRTKDRLLVGLHAVAFVMIEDKKDVKKKAQNCLANSEGEITQESITAAVKGHLEAAIATKASNTYLTDILSDTESFINPNADENSDLAPDVKNPNFSQTKTNLIGFQPPKIGFFGLFDNGARSQKNKTNGFKNKLEERLKTLGLTLVDVGFFEIEGQNPYGKEYAVPVDLEAVQTKDKLQADLSTVFFVQITDAGSNSNNRPVWSVLIENGEVTQKRVEIAVRQRVIPALRAAASRFQLKDIDYSQYSKRSKGKGSKDGLPIDQSGNIPQPSKSPDSQISREELKEDGLSDEEIDSIISRRKSKTHKSEDKSAPDRNKEPNKIPFAEQVYQLIDLLGIGLELVGIVISDVDGADIYGTEYAVEVELAGPNALRLKDFMRADIQATFLVTLSAEEEDDIKKAYSALSEGEAISPQRIQDAVRKRAIEALQIEGLNMNLKEIHENRAQFAENVEQAIQGENNTNGTTGTSQKNKKGTLKDLGLTLKEVIITEIEESDYYLDNANDYFDIQGIARRTALIGAKQVQKREKELQTERLLEATEKKHQEKSLKTLEAREQLAIEQERIFELYRLRQETELKTLRTLAQVQVDNAEIQAARAIIDKEIDRLEGEAQRVRAEEGVNTAIEEARKQRANILVEIARQEAERRRVLANADAESKKTVSDLHPLAMIVTTLAPQLMEHLPEITEIAKAMSLQPGALTNAHIYMADGNGKGLNNMLLPGGFGNLLSAIVDKLDLNKPPNGGASVNGNGSNGPQPDNSSNPVSPSSDDGSLAMNQEEDNASESQESVQDLAEKDSQTSLSPEDVAVAHPDSEQENKTDEGN